MRVGMLTVPDDAVLEEILGEPVRSRRQAHSWPLSLIERVETSSGRYALKTQRADSSVERAFYAAVDHPRLIKPLRTWRTGDCDCLILPWIEGTAEDWSAMPDEAIRSRARALGREFAAMVNAPVFFDFSTRERFAAALEAVRETLLGGGLAEDEFEALRRWLNGPGAICWDAPVGLLHGDLKGENLLGGYVIDWQRPLLGPLPLEERVALYLEGRTPAPGDPFAALNLLYHAHWYAWAFGHCLPLTFVRGQSAERARACLAILREK